jgi:hypothetical protein
VALNPRPYAGRTIGDGHCVAFVRHVAELPHTSRWRQGIQARGGYLQEGTAIATFTDGRYVNSMQTSHCAILIADMANGLEVWDQWLDQPVHQRTLRFRGGEGGVNDGDNYFAIEIEMD